MKKSKKLFAIIGIILLVGLYLSTLIFALIDTELGYTLLKVSISATIFFPVILYIMGLVYKLNKNNIQTTKTMEDSKTHKEA